MTMVVSMSVSNKRKIKRIISLFTWSDYHHVGWIYFLNLLVPVSYFFALCCIPYDYGFLSVSKKKLGEWYEGRWHGAGRATFTNGDSYDGQYSFDQRHGRGTYHWNDGRIYSGGFVADRREGHGVYTWPDGAKYEGYFRDGQHDGQGTYRVSVCFRLERGTCF